MSEIIDRVILGSCRFMYGTCRFGTNLERGTSGHLVLGGVLNDDAQVQSLEAQKERRRVPHDVHMHAPLNRSTEPVVVARAACRDDHKYERSPKRGGLK